MDVKAEKVIFVEKCDIHYEEKLTKDEAIEMLQELIQFIEDSK